MKTIIEYYLSAIIMIFALIFTLESFSNIHQLHRAHHCRDAVVFMIDSFDTYDDAVKEMIGKEGSCQHHPVHVGKENNRFVVDVTYYLKYAILGLEKEIHLKSFSNMVF